MPAVLITGANRGIGLEFARQYAADGYRVYGACRRPEETTDLGAIDGDVAVHRLDVTDLATIEGLARTLDGEAIDILINNAGVLARGQRAGEVDYAAWELELKTNTIGPIAVARALLPHLRRGEGRRLAFLSSTLGSIASNNSGAYYLYRSSKAGLNAAVRSLAHEIAPEGMIALLLHPGWVRTDMGGPNATLTPKDSVAGMRRVIERAGPADSGRFLGYEGREIPW